MPRGKSLDGLGSIIIGDCATNDVALCIISQHNLVPRFFTIAEKPVLDDSFGRNAVLKALSHTKTVGINGAAFGHYTVSVIHDALVVEAQRFQRSDIEFLTQDTVFIGAEYLIPGIKCCPRGDDYIIFYGILNTCPVELIFRIKFSGLIEHHELGLLENILIKRVNEDCDTTMT